MSKLKTFDSSYYIVKSYFEEDGKPNYLIFQQLNKYFKVVSNNNSDYVLSWTSKGLSNESIKPPSASNNDLAPSLSYYGAKIQLPFAKACLKHDKVTFNHGKIVNIYFVYKLIKIDGIYKKII